MAMNTMARLSNPANARRGFTLVELILVVLIIAVLSLIAVPNFLEAQVRAKVARLHADMRTVAAAIESYATDHGREPVGAQEGQFVLGWGEQESDLAYSAMTTPVAYITQAPHDPFCYGEPHRAPVYRTTQYVNELGDASTCLGCPKSVERGHLWALSSRGPGGTRESDFHPPVTPVEVIGSLNPLIQSHVYDPTNGTISKGWVIRTNRGVYLGPLGN